MDGRRCSVLVGQVVDVVRVIFPRALRPLRTETAEDISDESIDYYYNRCC